MPTLLTHARVLTLVLLIAGIDYSLSALADDVTSFATGGYATGLRTKEMMSIIDTDGDGTISKAEWAAFQEKVFNALDTRKRGKLSVDIFAGRSEVRLGTGLATGGYARGLSSAELAQKIDVNGDGWISRDEWIAYQTTRAVLGLMRCLRLAGTADPKAIDSAHYAET